MSNTGWRQRISPVLAVGSFQNFRSNSLGSSFCSHCSHTVELPHENPYFGCARRDVAPVDTGDSLQRAAQLASPITALIGGSNREVYLSPLASNTYTKALGDHGRDILTKHVIKLTGVGARGARASSALLRDLLDVLVEVTRRTIRLRVEGRSTARGNDPDWLISAADFEVLGFEEGSTEIMCEANAVGEIAPEAFAQVDMFSPVDTSKSGLGLFEEMLAEIHGANLDSDSYDDRILDKLCELRKVFGHQIEAIWFGGIAGVRVDPGDLEEYSALRRSIPRAERVRVLGLLDTLTATRRAFQLKLNDGSTIRGRFNEEARGRFQDLWNQQVLITGEAEFKPSGLVRHLHAGSIEEAAERHQIWAEQPRATQAEFDTNELRGHVSPEGLGALIGKWPGDETDEEIEAQLRDLS